MSVGLLAPFVFTSSEALAFKKQMWGVITFTANIVLANQVGYFEGAAELKPLLHIWSLADEEQFYLLLPVSLGLIPAWLWLWLLLLALLANAALCFFVYRDDGSSAFYLILRRLWELAAGSIGAIKRDVNPGKIFHRNSLHKSAYQTERTSNVDETSHSCLERL